MCSGPEGVWLPHPSWRWSLSFLANYTSIPMPTTLGFKMVSYKKHKVNSLSLSISD